ncbi:S8 family serine peptidase [Actinacidiphila acidipaludis]|uniref:S8 family serine peptidase n=1 Tax=Actinacidiphila acidipaludis TaxID=2873382 RepID=A0ABS7QHM2_9ACTN|nr:S8 family serine peptidase [Streptomyces acidipaludis]MBY8881279.1 S8 family serine peptidase [Streptomyces acidipaludis]
MPRAHPPGGRFARAAVVLAVAAASATAVVPASAAPPSPRTPLDASARQSPPQPARQREGVVPGQVLVGLAAGTSVTGGTVPGTRLAARTPHTSNARLDARLKAVGATSLRPAVQNGGSGLAGTYVLQTSGHDSAAVARALQGAPGVAYAEPDRYVNTMNSGAVPLPANVPAIGGKAVRPSAAAHGAATPATAAGVPANDALTSSAQALLNSGGVDAVGAFSLLQGHYGQQPGAGETVTNVSIGDLTDQSMADAGDDYVQSNGPTTVLKDGQRYLDLPSMPLIPAYVAKDGGGLDGAASTENQDPGLGEVMLDFSVMSPLAHDRQRPGATGSGYTDLLGIAPGADYRLVVPEQPTTDRIAGALLAAAHQSPRPDVITASLGFGTDAQGFPGRYLEDDPFIRATVAAIVRDGIVVSISSNDGTRLYTPAAVGPDGGSTPTDLAPNAAAATVIDDDALSTAPSRVPDSGAIAAGGTTLDDTLSSGAGGPATTAETRISGFGTFSSGFGSRVDLSAPSDNILAFSHSAHGSPQDVDVSLNGGTSASAPEIAAAAAVVLQAGRLAGHHLTPGQVRQVLARTGRAVPTPPQIDRSLHVGPQVDVTAAVQQALGGTTHGTDLVRLSVAHHVTLGDLGGAFLEATDQNRIDLGDHASGGDGEGLVGPVTFAGDVTGAPANATYSLTVGSTVFRSAGPAIRVTPEQLLTAAGLPVVATADRDVTVTYRVLAGGRTVASATRTLAVGPSDGQYAEASAPKAPATVAAGAPVTVSYDLTGVTGTSSPQLVLSTVGHWNPDLAPLFTAAWHQPLTAPKGTVTIPASAFHGGGLYGIGIAQSGFGGNPLRVAYGEFAPVRVAGGTSADRPVAPLLTGADGVAGHTAEVTRAASQFTLDYDVRAVHGARGAEVEFSSPAPTQHGSLNTFTNANGTALDDNGVDSPSVLHKVLPATAGHVRLDAAALGLTGSDLYGVRVLALDRDGHVAGQASPLSSLAFDDGLAPGGATVQSFAAAGDHSVAALARPDGGSEVRHYATATGRYGAVITSDSGDGSSYQVIGATADRALLAHRAADGDLRIETWNTGSDTLVGSTTLAAGDATYVTGRVDGAHARGAVLLHGTGNADEVLPVDLASGAAGAPIPADPSGVGTGTYGLMTVDPSSGDVFLAKTAGAFNCLGGVTVARVDLTARTVTADGSASGCGHGLATDGAGTLYDLSATVISVNIIPTGVISPIDEAAGKAAGDATTLRVGKPSALAVDGTHKIAVVSYPTPAGTPYFGAGLWVPDNNATGQLSVVDLTTGQVLRTLPGFVIGGHGGAEDAVQLDPATRTGWTFGPDDAQIQQFSY